MMHVCANINLTSFKPNYLTLFSLAHMHGYEKINKITYAFHVHVIYILHQHEKA